ncbi:hypothetical protein [Mycolicibacterium helvum]|uniref:Uncharacterized protein n=1 Tax=Mycolicibacterium helvum TaxID=1534349 RepID=A0A7I7TDQ2_9MYCO|nr:hypothetical protein [Mycolicibacterium helvum]BBY67354.1 hypothetical protein MHEL_55970 [Mycolicibacterium helvum]
MSAIETRYDGPEDVLAQRVAEALAATHSILSRLARKADIYDDRTKQDLLTIADAIVWLDRDI